MAGDPTTFNTLLVLGNTRVLNLVPIKFLTWDILALEIYKRREAREKVNLPFSRFYFHRLKEKVTF